MKKAFIGVMLSILTTYATAQVTNTHKTIDPILDWKRISSIINNNSISPDWRDSRGYSAVYYQLNYGSEKRAERLVLLARRKGIWIEGKKERLLEIAIRLNSQRVVAALIKHGEPVSSVDESGSSPILLAAATGRLEIVRMLIKAGADAYCRGCAGEGPIEAALGNGHWRIVLLMRDLGVDITSYQKEKNQKELIFRAIDGNSLMGLLLLTSLGFTLDVKNSQDMTPLEYALITHSSEEIVESLFMQIKSFCLKNSNGQRTLDVIKTFQSYTTPPSEYWMNAVAAQTSKCDKLSQ